MTDDDLAAKLVRIFSMLPGERPAVEAQARAAVRRLRAQYGTCAPDVVKRMRLLAEGMRAGAH
jgi:hypothetical protein